MGNIPLAHCYHHLPGLQQHLCRRGNGVRRGHGRLRGFSADSPNAGKHRHDWYCVCGTSLRYEIVPCVDEKINATGAAGEDNICDLCGTAMVLAAPTAPEGDGFYPYTVKEGSKDVTHYYVTHYEVGEKAEELTVMATGKQLTYQWYYRLSEDETEAGHGN